MDKHQLPSIRLIPVYKHKALGKFELKADWSNPNSPVEFRYVGGPWSTLTGITASGGPQKVERQVVQNLKKIQVPDPVAPAPEPARPWSGKQRHLGQNEGGGKRK